GCADLPLQSTGGLDERLRDDFGRDPGARQETPAGRGRERYGGHELGVVAPSGALPRVRPAPVEHELAPGVVLDVQRQRADQVARVVVGRKVAGLPGGVGPDRAAALERSQKLVAVKRVAAGERVPFGGVDVQYRRDAVELEIHPGRVFTRLRAGARKGGVTVTMS